MAARFKIDQLSSAGAGVPNRSRWDLDTTEDIIFNVVGPAAGATYTWTLVDRAGNELADGTLSSGTGLTTQIAAAKVQSPCAYVVRLTETLANGATSSQVLAAVAMGAFPSPDLDGGLTQAEIYYMIMAVAGAAAGGGGAELSDDPPEDVAIDAEDPGLSEFASRSDHTHRLRHRWLKLAFPVAKATDEVALVATLYLETGTLLAPARVFIGTDTGTNQATLRLIRADDPTVLATWSVTGILQNVNLLAPVALTAGWHQLTLQCNSPNANAILSGIDWLYLED